MYRIYNVLLHLLTPLMLIRLLWKSRMLPGYRFRWSERFGYLPFEADECIWLHAVSVGEVQAAAPLIRTMMVQFPDLKMLITTTTPTGSQRVIDLFDEQVLHCYVPYDLPFAVKQFLDQTRPRIAVIMETELWPNMFRMCNDRDIPIVVANARISNRSFKGYQRFSSLVRQTLDHISAVAAQSAQDADRFRQLGMKDSKVNATGNIKFDVKLPASLKEQAEVLRRSLGFKRPIWIAASTHEGEEEQILAVHREVQGVYPDSLLILVPRHPDRFSKVASLCRKEGFVTVLRSENQACLPETEVYLGDTLGELPLMYAASDVAFVGGSLVSVGGHNMLEPAALGIPVLVGPHTSNFSEITQMLLSGQAGFQVEVAQQCSNLVERFFRDPNYRHNIGQNGCRLVEDNRGALQRMMVIIGEVMASKSTADMQVE